MRINWILTSMLIGLVAILLIANVSTEDLNASTTADASTDSSLFIPVDGAISYPTTSIGTDYQFDNIKTIDRADSKYGTITIKNAFGLPEFLGGGDIAQYKVTDNTDECLSDCRAEGTAILYTEGQLFQGIKFQNEEGKTIQGVNQGKLFLIRSEDYQVDVPTYDNVCSDLIDKDNGTIQECTIVKNGSVTETKTRDITTEYQGEILPPGTYKWRIEINKDYHLPVDWVPTAFGEDLSDWLWFNNSWEFKRQINLSSTYASARTRYSVKIDIPYNTSMNADFSDLRFLNASETGTLNCWNQTQVSSTNSTVWCMVPNLVANDNTTIWMYYGNPTATQSWDITTAFLFGDDFPGASISATRWATSNGLGGSAPSVSGGVLHTLGAVGGWSEVITNMNFTQNMSVMWKGNHTTAAAGNKGVGFSECSGPSPTFCQAPNNGTLITTSGSTFGLRNIQGAVSNFPTMSQNANVFDIYRINRNMTGALGQRLEGTSSTNSSGSSYTNKEMGVTIGAEDTASAVDVDWIFVRNFTNPDPVANIMSEQVVPLPVNISVTLISPVNVSNISTNSVIFNSTLNPTLFSNVTNATLYIWYSNTSIAQRIINSTTNNANITTAWVQNVTGLFIDDNYKWNVLACAVNSTSSTACAWGLSNFTFTLDSNPPVINVTSPRGYISYLVSGKNLTLNWSIVDFQLASEWFTFNNQNFTVFGAANSTQFVVNATTPTNLTFYANDSFGNLGNNFTSWTYTNFEYAQFFNNQTTEGNIEKFVLNLSTINNFTSAYLVYNHTPYLGDISNDNFNYSIVRMLTIPNIDFAQFNNTFYWNLVYTDGSQFNTTTNNQSVLGLSLDKCTTNNAVILNFTLFDEDNRSILNRVSDNGTIEVAATIYPIGSSTAITVFNGSFSSTAGAAICINSATINSSSFKMDYETRYYATQYATEFKYGQNISLTNATIPNNIQLYDLASASNQDYLLEFNGGDLAPLTGVVIDVLRQYVPINQYLSVESPITDENGNIVAHLVSANAIYNFNVYKDNRLLGSFTGFVAKCQNILTQQCTGTFNILNSDNSLTNFQNFDNVQFTPSIDRSTRVLSVSFNTINGVAQTVTANVLLSDNYGNNSICSNSLNAPSGVLTCSIPQVYGNTTVLLNVLANNRSAGNYVTYLGDTPTQIFGGTRIVLAMLMYSSIVLLFMASPVMIVIGALLGIGFAGALAVVDGGTLFGVSSIILWFIVAGAIIIYQVSRSVR